jgi:tRNA(Ile)-lysidine synthase
MFDADRVTWPLRARRRLPGDRMRPRGGRGSRKLSDLMIDAKIGRDARGVLPVLTSAANEILYVPGLRLSEIARPTATTRRALTVDYLSVV